MSRGYSLDLCSCNFAFSAEVVGGGFGARWFEERLDRDALVDDVEDGEEFLAAGGLENYGVSGGGLHQCASERRRPV